MKKAVQGNAIWFATGTFAVAALVAPEVARNASWPVWVYDAATALTALTALAGARRLPVADRFPWLLISAGLGCFFVGDVIWDLSEQVWHTQNDLPSGADLAYVVAFPLLIAAGLSLIGRYTTLGKLNSFLDTTILAMGLSLVVWEPLLIEAGHTVGGALVAGAYPIGDIALVGLAALLVGGTRGGRPVTLLLVGALLLLSADLIFLAQSADDSFVTGNWADRLFVIARLIIAAAPWAAAQANLRASPLSLRRGWRTLIATMIVVGALVALPIDFGLAATGPLRRHELLVRVMSRVILLAAVGIRLLRQSLDNEALVEELDTSSARLATVVHNTADAVVFASADGTVLEWNKAAEDLFGRTREEVLGTSALEYVQPEAADAVATILTNAGASQELTLPLRIRGRLVPVMVQIATVRDDADELVGFVAVARDATSRLFADQARQTFAHLDPDHAVMRFAENLVTFLPFDVLSLTSVDGDDYRELARLTRTIKDGASAFRIASPEHLLAGDQSAFIPVDDGTPYILLRPSELIDRGAPIDDRNINSLIGLRLRDRVSGEVRGYLTLGFRDPIGATQQHADALAAVGPDIAQALENMLLYEQQRLAADQLRELNDLRDGFVAMVAHDLHGPLTSIGSASSVLHSHRARMDDAQVDDMLRGITTTARQLARLTSDLVDTTRQGGDRFPCQLAYVEDLGAIVTSAATGAAGERGARLTTTAERGIVVLADRDRMSQIVGNLVTNALKFTDGSVEVSTCRCEDEAVITVADHGPGIPAASASRVFERYARIAQPGHQPKGSGLGLYITHELVVAHGGDITHRPTAGGGATFEVRLPIFHGARPEA